MLVVAVIGSPKAGGRTRMAVDAVLHGAERGVGGHHDVDRGLPDRGGDLDEVPESRQLHRAVGHHPGLRGDVDGDDPYARTPAGGVLQGEPQRSL